MTQDQQVPLGPRASARIAACFGSRMLSARCAIVAIAAVVLVAGQLPQAQADKVYFAGWLGSVGGRANPDGSGFEPLVVLSDYGHGLALDPAGGQMYWMSGSLIKGANLDSNRASYFVFENTVDGVAAKSGLAFDAAANRFYWGGRYGIFTRAVGSPRPTRLVASEALGSQYGDFQLDSVHGKLYWVDNARRIDRMNLDGTGLEILPLTLLPDSLGSISLDIPHGKIYWGDRDGYIVRANLDGSNEEALFKATQSDDSFGGVAIDGAHGIIYWSEFGFQPGIHHANLDGSGQVWWGDSLYGSSGGGPVIPFRIALLIPEPSSFALAALGLITLAACVLPGVRQRQLQGVALAEGGS